MKRTGIPVPQFDCLREDRVESGTVRLEVVDGVEGPCLGVTGPDRRGGFRIAGPKPWGGGRVVHEFTVRGECNLQELKKAVDAALSEDKEREDG